MRRSKVVLAAIVILLLMFPAWRSLSDVVWLRALMGASGAIAPVTVPNWAMHGGARRVAGVALLQNGDLSDAAQVLDRAGDSTSALYWRGEAYAAVGDEEAALNVWRRARAGSLFAGRATRAYNDGEPVTAVALQEKALVIGVEDTAHAVRWLNIYRVAAARQLRAAGDEVTAEKLLQAALDDAPVAEEAALALADLLAAQGRIDEAATVLHERAVLTDRVAEQLVDLLLAHERLEAATASVDQIAQAGGVQTVTILTLRARVATAAGDTAEAMASWRAVIAAAPETLNAYFQLAAIQVDAGDRVDAEATLLAALDMAATPEDEAWVQLVFGDFYAAADDDIAAVAAYEASLRLDPTRSGTYSRLARAYTRTGRSADAGAILAAGVARFPGDAFLNDLYNAWLAQQ